MAYALGKYSYGICDRCGFRYKYLELREEWNKLKVCPECYEPKARQLEPSQTGSDPEALYQPRPDVPEFNDVTINFTGVSASASVGSVTIAGVTTGPTFDSTSVTFDVTSKTFDEA